MEWILVLPVLASFLITLFGIPRWIQKAKSIGLIWEDMNKYDTPKNVAGSGGIIVSISFVLGVLIYIAIITFYFNSVDNITKILALLCTVFFALIIGFIDDILGWAKGGLSKRFRLLLLIFASIPLVVINAGESTILGVEVGLLFPLFLIPLAIVGTTSTFNFLAGFNGLEASQGMIFLGGLSLVCFFTGSSWLSLILLIMIASLGGFYIFNQNPAKVFPGDVMTYPLGALIGTIAILGNMEKIAVFFFIPYIIEVILKSRGKLKKQSFGKPNEDNSLDLRYKKIYGLTHLSIFLLKNFKKNKKVYEEEVVWLINGFQILVILLGLFLFRSSIF